MIYTITSTVVQTLKTMKFQAPAALLLLVLALTNDVRAQIDPADCDRRLDVFLLVDGSDSVRTWNYNTMTQQALPATASSFQLGPSRTRVGVLQFSSASSTTVYPLTGDRDNLTRAINAMRERPEESSATDFAITLATSQLLASKRVDVPQVIVLFSDGLGNYPSKTREAVATAQRNDIRVVTVDLKNTYVTSKLIEDVSTDRFLLAEYSQMLQRVDSLATIVCPKPNCTFGMNLVFVLDGSDSISDINFQKSLNATLDSSRRLWELYPNSSIGLVVFATDVFSIIQPTTSLAEFTQKWLKIEHPSESTRTHLGIAEARRQLNNVAGVGSQLTKIMVVITDGDSNNRTATMAEADAAKAENITIVSIGVGDRVNTGVDGELYSISSDFGTSKGPQFFANFSVLMQELPNLVSSVCDGQETPATTTPFPDQLFQGECSRTLDVLFLVDSSNDVGATNLKALTSAVSQAAGYFLGQSGSSRVGVMTFSDNVTQTVSLTSSASQVQNGIGALSYISGSRLTMPALTEAVNEIGRNLRTGTSIPVPAVIVLLITGRSGDSLGSTVFTQTVLAATGFKLFTLGVTSSASRADLLLLTSNSPQRVQMAQDYSQVPGRLSQLSQAICLNA